jgi:hypothetical protein
MIKFGLPPQLHVDHSDRGPGKGILTPEKFENVANDSYGWCKPIKGGLWTSTLKEEVWSDWCNWTWGEQFMYRDGEKAFILTVSSTAKIFEINGRDDVKWLKDRYIMTQGSEGFAKSYLDELVRLDWTKVSHDFDGVHLTEFGNRQLHLADMSYSLNAWDAESTVWLRWAFTNCTPTNIINPYEKPKMRKITINGSNKTTKTA